MAMENRSYNWGEKKTLDLRLQKLLPLHQNKKRKDTKRIERKKKLQVKIISCTTSVRACNRQLSLVELISNLRQFYRF